LRLRGRDRGAEPSLSAAREKGGRRSFGVPKPRGVRSVPTGPSWTTNRQAPRRLQSSGSAPPRKQAPKPALQPSTLSASPTAPLANKRHYNEPASARTNRHSIQSKPTQVTSSNAPLGVGLLQCEEWRRHPRVLGLSVWPPLRQGGDAGGGHQGDGGGAAGRAREGGDPHDHRLRG
jgi:hypothetical protein